MRTTLKYEVVMERMTASGLPAQRVVLLASTFQDAITAYTSYPLAISDAYIFDTEKGEVVWRRTKQP